MNLLASSHTRSEENYLKAIYAVSQKAKKGASTTAIAGRLQTKASSVTDMVKKLSEKGLVDHRPYHGVRLTDQGRKVATQIIRRHRLWETFLVNHLNYRWDEVHELAEQLEHIRSHDLTDRLDTFMDHPKFDPHGDPIPDRNGHFADNGGAMPLSQVPKDTLVHIVGVRDSSPAFLKLLDGLSLKIGTQLTIMRRFEFDNSAEVSTRFNSAMLLNERVCENLTVKVL
ncbi:MAG: metal-dependent transcriptional regulator [Flavobacteriales bacterium]|nr:metal-dependent transcriptional regulator [Flavobacteriales bacterium]